MSTPATASIPAGANLTDAVFANASEVPTKAVFRRRGPDGWQPVTTAQFAAEVTAVGKALIAAGVQPGDRVLLLSATRYEWTLCDYAIWSAGAVTVPVYDTSSAEQVSWYLDDSGAVMALVETAEHEALVEKVHADLPELRGVRRMDSANLPTLLELGRDVGDDEFTARRTAVNAEDLATIIYTSGTTGRPKGCELTHRNVLFDVTTAATGLSSFFNDSGSTLLFLPLAHVFARLIQCGCVQQRSELGHTSDLKNLAATLVEFQPTFLLSVPRVFEKVYNSAQQKAHAHGGLKGRIFDAADDTAVAYSQALDAGRVSPLLRARHALFEQLVYRKLRAALGGRITDAISGGAPLGARLGHFYRGIGLPVYEGYGLTETSAGAAVNLNNAFRIGTVGRPLPGTTVRIADDGEILMKGDHIFRGYWRNVQATAEAMDTDGWFHTGDLGALDDDGFLTITGRKKEIIVTAAGKNVAPAALEDRLRAHPLISQVMVVGDQRPFVAALVTLDPDAFAAWCERHGRSPASVADLRDDDALRADIQAAVDDANAAVSRAEAIRTFTILPVDFTEEGGQLTPSLKVKRAVVAEEFAADIAGLYRRPAVGRPGGD